MPALSPTMKSGTLAKWCKKEGDTIKAGEVIAEIETDKALMEVEAVDEGKLGKIVVEAGTHDVKVNAVIAILLEKGEGEKELKEALANLKKNELENVAKVNDTQEEKSKTSSSNVNDNIAATPPPKTFVQQSATDTQKDIPTVGLNSGNKRIFASPLAKRIAQQENINLSYIEGTGPHGRIVKNDVLTAKEKGGLGIGQKCDFKRIIGQDRVVPLAGIAATVAKRLVEAKQSIPHFYLSVDILITKLLEMRAEINTQTLLLDPKIKPQHKISVNDMVIKAVALALQALPDVNAAWSDEGIVRFANVDISVAVSTSEGNLITPIVKNANYKSIFEISNEVKSLRNKAEENKLRLEEFQGGGFTISNLGMYGVDRFQAIVNPPQAAILAVGAGKKQAVVINDQIKVEDMMSVTLSCDHRIIDGALGAQFLQILKRCIENPSMLLI